MFVGKENGGLFTGGSMAVPVRDSRTSEVKKLDKEIKVKHHHAASGLFTPATTLEKLGPECGHGQKYVNT
jgi:hypothetical protein